MKKILILILTILSFNLFAQENITELTAPIIKEGKMLYKSEMASWYGTDLFLEQWEDKGSIGGYFSYADNDVPKCIFFSKADAPVVIGTVSFDSIYNVKTALIDLEERAFSSTEKDLFQIRRNALLTIQTDTLFKIYENTNLNLIPLIHNGTKKVYVLTAPQRSGIVIFGNDYLINFDDENNITDKKQLHKNIIPTYYNDNISEGKEVVGSMHSHSPETGCFITATDVCTLMLYGKYTGWKKHTIVSKEYMNVWNCKTNRLVVIPMETIKKINEDQEKKKKKRERGRGRGRKVIIKQLFFLQSHAYLLLIHYYKKTI